MFGLFTKNIYLADIMDGFHDIHCHFLPGVDDGSPDNERSVHLLNEFEQLGVKALYFTPHLINGMYDNRTEADMREQFSEFKYDGKIKLNLAAEYFIDDKLSERLKGEPLTYKDNHLLTEFQLNSYALNSMDVLFDASVNGFKIIIAHPERYSFLHRDRDGKTLERIFNSHYDLQLNLLSLTGFHGKSAHRLAEELLADDKYDFVGTDIHSIAYIEAMKESKISSKLFDKLKKLKENNETLF